MATTESEEPFKEPSFESLTAGITYTDPNFPLQLIHKKEYITERTHIHSTKMERLSFYRTFTTSTTKTDIIMVQNVNVNSFLWFYMFNIFFKSLPHGFLHFFLAAYAPEEHIFVAKMVPISYGIIYLFMMTGFLEISVTMDQLFMLLHYCVQGPLHKNPWNRCKESVYFDIYLNQTIHCYNANEFAEKFKQLQKNKINVTYLEFTIQTDDEEFELAQIGFYRNFIMSHRFAQDYAVIVVVWAIIQLTQLYVHKRTFWKILNFAHWARNVMLLIAFVHLTISYHALDTSVEKARVPIVEESSSTNIWSTDLDLLAESITAPHTVHVLTARSSQKIDPTVDSAVMVFSNACMFIFEGLLDIKLKAYIEQFLHTEVPVPIFNQFSGFYIWPIYLQTFYLGDLFSVIFFSLNLIEEITMVIVIYFCATEMVVCEFKKVKKYMVAIFVTVGVTLMQLYTDVDSRYVLWAYSKSISTLAECVFVYVLYPIGRLYDDFTFHYGVTPTQLRMLSLRLVPVYYLVKVYIMIGSLWDVIEYGQLQEWVPHYRWSWGVFLMPLILGGIYTVYRYVVVYRMTWPYVFRPLPKWGPRDFCVRQLRKQYDSRFYIGCEVPRLLSRYLLSKRDAKVFKVDVRYDVVRRSTIRRQSQSTLRFKEDKKEA